VDDLMKQDAKYDGSILDKADIPKKISIPRVQPQNEAQYR